MLVIVFAPIIGCTKKKEKRYGHMLRAEEFTSRHAVTLGDKGGGRNAFYPPSLEFWILASLFTCFLLLPCYLFPAFSAYYCLKSNG